jgi:hypothetical protein
MSMDSIKSKVQDVGRVAIGVRMQPKVSYPLWLFAENSKLHTPFWDVSSGFAYR